MPSRSTVIFVVPDHMPYSSLINVIKELRCSFDGSFAYSAHLSISLVLFKALFTQLVSLTTLFAHFKNNRLLSRQKLIK
jgi:hypothetical protein